MHNLMRRPEQRTQKPEQLKIRSSGIVSNQSQLVCQQIVLLCFFQGGISYGALFVQKREENISTAISCSTFAIFRTLPGMKDENPDVPPCVEIIIFSVFFHAEYFMNVAGVNIRRKD